MHASVDISRRDLIARVFDPASVVIVGASAVPGKWGYRAAAEVLADRRDRRIHLVNARGGEVMGHPLIRSVTDLPEVPDLAVITVPLPAVSSAIDDLLALGVRTFLCITAGFGEESIDGARLEAEIMARVRAADAVLVGPNCMGILDSSVPFRCMPWTEIPPGPVSFISQSGGFIMDLALRLRDHGTGMARAVSIGNASDVTATDLLDLCAGHEATRAIAVYVEAVPDGRDFARAIQTCVESGKPVVVMTPDDSPGAVRASRAHTNSLITRRRAIRAAVEEAGGHYAETARDLAEMLVTLLSPRRRGPKGTRQLAVISDTGGPVVLLTGAAERAGLSVPQFQPELQARISALSSPRAQTQNPVDLVDNLTVETAVDVLDTVLASDEVGGALMNLHVFVHETPEDEARMGRRLAEAAARSGKPVTISARDPAAPGPRAAADAGLPVFRDAEAAARAMAMLLSPPSAGGVPSVPAPAPPTDQSARDLLLGAGIAFPPSEEVTDSAAARAAARRIGFPVVLKVVGPAHKTDVDGVLLDVGNEDAVVQGFDRLIRIAGATGVLVEVMADTADAVELIAGVTWDASLGPVLTVGMGGIMAEILDDVVHALAPADEARVTRMLGQLRGRALLHGPRGRRPVDIKACAAAIAALSRVAAARPDLVTIEVNPFLAGPKGTVALDALIVRRQEA
jgi:acetate---CoA ligase (ADP-forming)